MSVDPYGPFGDARWWSRLAIGAGLGAIGAVAALVFVGVVSAGQSILWPDDVGLDWFSGSWRIAAIMTAGGLVVGLIHVVDKQAREVNVFAALAGGTIERRAVPGAVAIAVVSLIGGFSLGPEVPTGMAGGGIASWLRRNADEEDTRAGVTAGITGAWGGLFTAPFTAVLLNVELSFGARALLWSRLAIDAAAAVVGFLIFFAVTAGWSDVLRLLELPSYSMELGHLLVAVGLGVLGAVVGIVFKLSMLAFSRLAARIKDRPVLRPTVAGLVLGLLGMALPLTLFLGTDGLADVTEDPAAIGVGLLVASALAKIMATSGALSFGFVGGPVFPLLFVGGSVGTIVNLVAPGVPLALAVTASMAAVPSAVIPAPLSVASLTFLIAGISVTEIGPVLVAAMVALMVGRSVEIMVRGRIDPATQSAQ